ncbi:MAG TPA: PD-(D/E)XK nuclease family protein, partial [Bacteroidota bacterium]
MAFENTFQWSHTRARTFQQCKRLYYYSYYGFWGGWEAAAPAETRLLYALKKMVTVPMWIGSIVHECIEHAMKSAKAGTIVRLDELQTMALQLASSGWLDSRKGAWKNDPKKAVNLAEHYYRRLVEPEILSANFGAMMRSLEAFHRSEVFRVACAEPASILAVEEMMTFPVGSVPVVMVADLALKRGEECHIYDWKTGPSAPTVADQLAVYALGAVSKWRYPREKVRVFVAYLAENTIQEVS